MDPAFFGGLKGDNIPCMLFNDALNFEGWRLENLTYRHVPKEIRTIRERSSVFFMYVVIVNCNSITIVFETPKKLGNNSSDTHHKFVKNIYKVNLRMFIAFL